MQTNDNYAYVINTSLPSLHSTNTKKTKKRKLFSLNSIKIFDRNNAKSPPTYTTTF